VVVDFITPETESTMWYFWGMARNFRVEDAELTAQIREGQGNVFSEDTAILEQQQKSVEAWPGRKLLMLNIDAGGVQARRMIDKMIAAEGVAAPTAAAPTSPAASAAPATGFAAPHTQSPHAAAVASAS
jgi:vanillate O-demethylase monooxygenase subunit